MRKFLLFIAASFFASFSLLSQTVMLSGKIIDETNKDNCHDWQIPDYEECANMLYRAQYSANYKTGFWELTIYTTKSLRVPENRCPEKQERTQRQKNC